MDTIYSEDQLRRISPSQASEKKPCCSIFLLCMNQVFSVVLNGVIELNLFDIIAKENVHSAFMSASDIASKMPTHHLELQNRLELMLNLLGSYSLLTYAARTNSDGNIEKVYGMSPVEKYFVSNESNGSLASFTSVNCSRAMSQVWPNFKAAVIDGEIDLFKKVHGMPLYQYTKRDPTLNFIFNKAMNDICTLDMQSIFRVYTGFEGISTLVDVGGGTGKMLNMIISKYPSIKGINFDLPHVIEKAPIYLGIAHIASDMYTRVPQGDAIIRKVVRHNWLDEKCLILLKNCHKALPQGGKLIVVDLITLKALDSDVSKIVSLASNLMFIQVSGKERTTNEFEALSKQYGFSRFELVCSTFIALGIMEFHK